MSDEAPWYRFGLGPHVVAEIRFSARPDVDDLVSLQELLSAQIAVLKRARDRRAARPTAPGEGEAEG